MRHHYVATGVDGITVAGDFKDVAIEEMKHAETLGERINFLGGEATTKPGPIAGKGKNVKDMAKDDLASEDRAVANYKAAVATAAEAGDVTTRRMLEDILGDEEGHQDTFGKMLGK
jgi:bacterioferritin